MLSVRFTRRVSALVLVGAAAVWPAPSWAQSVTRSGDERITVDAQAVPIGRVLRELMAVAPVEALMVDPKVENHPVSIRLVNATPAEAINDLLAGSTLPYTLWGGEKGPWRIFVGDQNAALRVTANSPLPRDAAAPAAAPQQEAPSAVREERGQPGEREEEKLAEAMAERQAEVQPITIMDDPGVPGGYTMIGESVIYNDPTFVPYKNRPEVRARRLATDVASIP